MSNIIPLYGHTSRETAYLITDYPYGRSRCQMLVWLEKSPTKGFRMVSQTQNPKTNKWNAEKKSTYAKFAGNLYLDENQHIHWASLTEYDGAKEALNFLRKFPDSDYEIFKTFAKAKIEWYKDFAEGLLKFTINNKVETPSEVEMNQRKQEYLLWVTVGQILGI